MPSSSVKRKGKSKHNGWSHNTYVHPSLALRPAATPVSPTIAAAAAAAAASNSSHATSLTSQGSAASYTVNERLEHLRRTQNPRSRRIDEADGEPAVRIGQHTLVPASRRRFAGPPPPRSWVEPGSSLTANSTTTGAVRKPQCLTYFPGISEHPDVRSLLHQTLKRMALDFAWHLEYDHEYLSTISDRHKVILLSYIAYYGSPDGIRLAELRALFPSETDTNLPDSTNENIRRIDLGAALAQSLTMKQLDAFWTVEKSRHEDVPEVWDHEVPAALQSHMRFPALTHLSLAHPGPSVSWASLIKFSRHLGALTHLSLAFWPRPRFHTKAPSFAYVCDTSDSGTESSIILQQLSRNTPSLQWLSLEGCQEWYACLDLIQHEAPPSAARSRLIKSTVNFDDDNDVPSKFGKRLRRNGPAAVHGEKTYHLPVSGLHGHNRSIAILSDRADMFDAGNLSEFKGLGVEWSRSWKHIAYLNIVPHWASENKRIDREVQTESYRVIAPTGEIEQRFRAREYARFWKACKSQAVELASFIRRCRLHPPGPLIEVDYGGPDKSILGELWFSMT